MGDFVDKLVKRKYGLHFNYMYQPEIWIPSNLLKIISYFIR